MVPTQEFARRRFALVAPYLPAPADSGGRIRIAALATALAAAGDVDLFARAFPVELDGPSADRARALAPYRGVSLFSRDLPTGVPGLDPWRARDATPMSLRSALAGAHRARPYAAIVAAHAYAFGALWDLRDTVRVLDEHNIESRYARDVTRAPRLEQWALARFERRAWRAADLVTCVRDDDAREISRHARDVAVIENGVDLAAHRWIPPSARAGRVVLFVGAMSHGPNVDAAVTLAREVLPRLRVKDHRARLVLCGRAPDATVRALASSHVTVTGTVAQTAPHFEEASVFANTVLRGEGTSLKVIEAAAAGLPIVSTEVGCRGVGFSADVHFARAEDPQAMADAILGCWRDPAEADRRAVAARAMAASLDWSALGARFVARVLARVEARRGAA